MAAQASPVLTGSASFPSAAPPGSPSAAPPATTSPPGQSAAPTPAPSAPAGDPCLAGTVCLLNPQVTQANIGSTICAVGWTSTIRPPASYTTPLKDRQMAALHLPGSPSDYEEDHRVPLELGGDPMDPRNLSPELRVAAGGNAERKDTDENAARASVCSGSRSLAQAQADFIARWLDTWPAYR